MTFLLLLSRSAILVLLYLAGTPFMEVNDIAVRPAKQEVTLGDGTTYTYGSTAPTEANTAAH